MTFLKDYKQNSQGNSFHYIIYTLYYRRLAIDMPGTIDRDIAFEVDWIYKRLTEDSRKD